MSCLRIAVVGAGTIGRVHMALLARESALQLCAVADPTAVAQTLAANHSVHCFATLAELLQTAQPDGVILATPNALHVPQALQCLAAGVPVLVEKPIAPTVAEGLQLVQAASASGVPVLIGHHRAHSPLMAAACEVVQSGALGRLVCVSGSATFHKPDSYFSEAPWRREPGAGPVLINLIHEIHNLRMLCGDIVQVQAMASSAVRGFAVEDTATLGLRFASGVLGSFVLSDTAASPRSWEQTSGENAAYARDAGEDCYVLSGTRGSLAIPSLRLKTVAGGETPSWYSPLQTAQSTAAPGDPLQLQLRHFAEVIRGKAQPRVSAADGLQNLCVLEAIARAAASGQTVSVESPALRN